MKMTFRWFGESFDSVTLSQIRQIPGMSGVVWTLIDVPVGEVWEQEKIDSAVAKIKANGLNADVVESVNVHEDIKLGLVTRERYIENYITTIRRLAKAGVKVICYNFMPVLDWARSELFHVLPDGSDTMLYDSAVISEISPKQLAEKYAEQTRQIAMPGWEPERLTQMNRYLSLYSNMQTNDIFDNMRYFLNKIIPVCEEVGVKMAIHPDDPPYSIFGLPRLIVNIDNIRKFLTLNNSPANGLTLCIGSLGANPLNNVPEMAAELAKTGRIHFAHIRNLKFIDNGVFYESAHLSSAGSLDLYAILRSLYTNGFDGYIRPDHGRMIWGETGRPGYGLYDRALGVTYINGIWESLEKELKNERVQ